MTTEVTERKRYEQFKATLTSGWKVTVAAVQAAYIIKTEALYKLEYPNWNEFCARELGISGRQVDANIKATKQLGLCEDGKELRNNFSNDTQINTAKALADVPEEMRDDVLEHLADAGVEPTAKAIRVAASVAGAEKKPPMRGRFDGLKPHVQEDFENRHVLDSLIGDVKRIMEKIEFYRGTNITTFLQADAAISDLKNIINNIKFAKPFADCMMCQQEGCKRCRERGWIPRPLFNQLPDDLKAMSVLRGNGETDE